MSGEKEIEVPKYNFEAILEAALKEEGKAPAEEAPVKK